jgi:hypothetical protein
MSAAKTALIPMLNNAIESEHAARIQYFNDLMRFSGRIPEPVIDRIKKMAADEETQENRYRTMIEDYMSGVRQTWQFARPAHEIQLLLEANRKIKKKARGFHKKLYKAVITQKNNQHYEFDTVEDNLRRVLLNENSLCSA